MPESRMSKKCSDVSTFFRKAGSRAIAASNSVRVAMSCLPNIYSVFEQNAADVRSFLGMISVKTGEIFAIKHLHILDGATLCSLPPYVSAATT